LNRRDLLAALAAALLAPARAFAQAQRKMLRVGWVSVLPRTALGSIASPPFAVYAAAEKTGPRASQEPGNPARRTTSRSILLPVGADSGGSRPQIRDDLAHHSDLISLGVPR